MRSARPTLLVPAALTLAVVLAPAASAQDAQYWTQQYGNEARLLGGAVVGGTEDLSATYYNPGRLALVGTPKLLLAGNVFEYTSITMQGRKDDATFESSRLGSVPSLFAGMIGRPADDDSRWAYSVLGRQFSNISIYERRDLTDVLTFPTDLTTTGFSLDESMSEYWAGLTWSKPLSEHVGIGVSGYVTIRSQSSRSLILAQSAVSQVGGQAGGIAVQRVDFNYQHVGMVAKLGIGADLSDWKLGLTATTPNLGLWGSGDVGFDESVVTQDLDGDGTAVTQIISSYQPGLKTDYRWASSVACGASRSWGRTVVHGTAEWFAGVPGYDVMDIEPVTSSDGSEVRDSDLRDEREAVFNFALGLEHEFREALRGYASFRTDYSAASPGQSIQIAYSIWDIYHVAAGATFQALDSEFTLGLIYAFGNTNESTRTAMVPEGEGDSELTEELELDIEFRRITGLVGFAFGF